MTLFLFVFTTVFSWAQYPENYQNAREQFEALASGFEEGVLTRFQVPSKTDQDLYVSYLYLPPKEAKKKLVVVASGVHGPEAYAGSALQAKLLKENLSDWSEAYKNTGFLIVHALNPWGFKHNRRGTENNVNLNRNFGYTSKVYQNVNSSYQVLQSVLSPDGKLTSCFFEKIGVYLSLLNELVFGEATISDLRIALGQGQYSDPMGPGYGGERPEPQVVDFKKRLDQVLPGYGEVVALDIHTGLGDEGQLHMIVSETATPDSREFWLESLKSLDQKGDLVLTDPLHDEGFYPTYGDFNEFIEAAAQASGVSQAHSITVEYGTVGADVVSQAFTARLLVMESQGHRNGYCSEFCKEKTQKEYKELFYPSSKKWKEQVLYRGDKLFKEISKVLN